MILISGDCYAQAFTTNGIGGANANGGGGQVMKDAELLVDNTAGGLKNALYGGAALGVLGLATMAFAGRWSWVWFFCIVGGLVAIAGAQTGIQYLTGEGDVLTNTANTAAVFG